MKEILLSVCVTAVMTAVYKALAPSDKFSSQIKLLVSCFFVVSVIGAVSGTVGLSDISDIINADTSYNDYTVQLEKQTAEETAKNLRGIIADELAKEGISPEKIYVDVNISDKGSISISEIKLVFRREDYEANAYRAIVLTRRLTGTKIKVTAEMPTGGKQGTKEREGQ